MFVIFTIIIMSKINVSLSFSLSLCDYIIFYYHYKLSFSLLSMASYTCKENNQICQCAVEVSYIYWNENIENKKAVSLHGECHAYLLALS